MNVEEVKVEEEVKKVIISVTSDAVKTKGAVRRNSTGKANTKTSPSLLSSDEKILPHYLRASTSSCHEFCKYGRKHVFEVKKRKPNLRKFLGSNKIPDEEPKAEVSTLRGRGKRPELKVKTTPQPEGGVLDKPKGIKQNGLKEIQLSGRHAVLERESFEASERMKLQTPSPNIASFEHSPSYEGEESSEEPLSIKTVTLSLAHQIEELSDTSETTKLEGSSPTEKRVISHEPTTPLSMSEISSDGSESMEIETPSPIHTLTNQGEGSSDEFLVMEIMTPSLGIESMGHADESIRSNPTATLTQKSLKAKIVPPTGKSTASTKVRASSGEDKSSEKALSMKLKTPSPNHKSFAATGEGNLTKNLKIVEEKKRQVTKVKTSPQLKTEVSDRAKFIREERIGLTTQPTVLKKKIVSPVEKITTTSVKPKTAEQKSPSSVKKVIIMSASPRVTKQKASSTIKRIDAPSSISLKPKPPVVKSTPALISSRRLSAQRNTGDKIMRTADLSKLREDPATKSSRASMFTRPPVGRETENLKVIKYRSLKPYSPAKIQAKVGKLEHTNEKVKEKILYVIEPKTLKTGLKPTKKELKKSRAYSSSSSSVKKEGNEDYETTLSEASELILDKWKTKRSKPVRSPKFEEKRRLSRTATATVPSEAKPPSPHKLKFRRGKVVSPMPEDNAPRKLRFRQAKGTSENQNSKEAVRRSFRRRRVSCGSATELITPSLEAPAIVLRHQDVQEKKDTQGLFNHVIEETASKLVETNKSKVKALVGAFETVISLQERRVSPTL